MNWHWYPKLQRNNQYTLIRILHCFTLNRLVPYTATMAAFACPQTSSEISSTETVDWDYYPAVPKRVSKPWLYEPHFPHDQPPDINYRRSILTDQANLKIILQNDHIPFRERHLHYAMQDKTLEGSIMRYHRDWAAVMLSDAQRRTDLEREKFCRKLCRKELEWESWRWL